MKRALIIFAMVAGLCFACEKPDDELPSAVANAKEQGHDIDRPGLETGSTNPQNNSK